MPKVTVILPVFNSEKYLCDSVNSILAQTYRDIELLIHDDGSSDRSLKLLQDIASQDPRVQLTSGANRGITPTLNYLLSRANGQYIARMDADDISLPERIERQVEFLDAHPEIDVVGCFVTLIDPKGRSIATFEQPTIHEDIDAAHLMGKVVINHPSAMYRKSAIMRIGGYNEEYVFAQDIDLWLRMAEFGKLSNIPVPLLLYRLHFASIGAAKRSVQVGSHARALTDAYERRGIDRPPDLGASLPRKTSMDSTYRKWGWWALKSGNIGTARWHSIVALLHNPFGQEGWQLLFCAIRGR